MSHLKTWCEFPPAIREHLIERMRDRSLRISDLNQLRIWVESRPQVREGEWFEDFGSFKPVAQTARQPTGLRLFSGTNRGPENRRSALQVLRAEGAPEPKFETDIRKSKLETRKSQGASRIAEPNALLRPVK